MSVGFLPDHPRRSDAYTKAAGAVLAFLIVGLLVKYAELLLTSEYRVVQPQCPIGCRLARIWMSLRFSWQELAIAAGLLGLIPLCRRRRPEPGLGVALGVAALRLLLGVTSLISVLGISYYAVYGTHLSLDDLDQLGWAPQLLVSGDLFAHVSVRFGAAVWLLVTFGLPWWMSRGSPASVARASASGAAGLAALAAVTWAAGRPELAEARLEPNPVAWMLFGRRAGFAELPPAASMAPIGAQRRVHDVTRRPKNVILVVLESTPAVALSAYDPNASGGRRLFADFGDEITVFDDVFAVSPNSTSSFVSLMLGHTPSPSAKAALEASAGTPTISEVLQARGFQTQLLLNGPTDATWRNLAARGFDRALSMSSKWEVGGDYSRTAWGFDDRMVFDEARLFLERQAPDSPPFFLVIFTNNPHHPYTSEFLAGTGTGDDDTKARHRLLVDYLMNQLAELYTRLRTSGLAETTAVLAVGDHGEAFGEHEGNYIHSMGLYSENLHVPLMLLHPQRLGLPARVRQLATLDDVPSTVFDLLGMEAPPRSGMSLLAEAPARVVFHLTDWGLGQIALRDRRYTWILARNGRELLFDRSTDPFEQRNVLAERPDVAAGFRARLEAGTPEPRPGS